MHYTDPATGLFHVGYLYLGASGATTSDLVTYTDLNLDSVPLLFSTGRLSRLELMARRLCYIRLFHIYQYGGRFDILKGARRSRLL